jgi:riboflavin biosynthesis pyrimidine reductase
MEKDILQLYPSVGPSRPLKGLYLEHDLRALSALEDRPYFYANFITSLDGRIAVAAPGEERLAVPERVANPRDWRLFQELAVQADLLITTGRYLREYAQGKAQELLRVYEDPAFQDLGKWRQEQGLRQYPDLAVISGSLDFPIPEVLTERGRKVIVATTESADPARKAQMERATESVLIAGDSRVKGETLGRALAGEGYRSVYSTAGPKVLHLLLAGGVLDRLYLTITGRILGGERFATILEGPSLQPPTDFELRSAHYDPKAPDGVGQLLTMYARASNP